MISPAAYQSGVCLRSPLQTVWNNPSSAVRPRFTLAALTDDHFREYGEVVGGEAAVPRIRKRCVLQHSNSSLHKHVIDLLAGDEGFELVEG